MNRTHRSNVALIERFSTDLGNRFDKALIPVLRNEDVEFRGSLGQAKRGHGQFAKVARVPTRTEAECGSEAVTSQLWQSVARARVRRVQRYLV